MMNRVAQASGELVEGGDNARRRSSGGSNASSTSSSIASDSRATSTQRTSTSNATRAAAAAAGAVVPPARPTSAAGNGRARQRSTTSASPLKLEIAGAGLRAARLGKASAFTVQFVDAVSGDVRRLPGRRPSAELRSAGRSAMFIHSLSISLSRTHTLFLIR
jgi:hypothetical protein